MKYLSMLFALMLLVSGGVLLTACDDDGGEETTIDVSTLPQACQDLAPLCDACT